jgi:dihydroflavonol-4-reductase
MNSLNNEKIIKTQDKIVSVVTGANGFVGSHLVDYLLEKGHYVKCIIRKSSNLQWLEGKDVELCTCGLNDVEALKTVFENADYIFHIAGVVKALRPEGFFKGNVETSKNVLEAALHAKNLKKIMITSSMAATGPTTMGGSVDELSPLNPMEPYGYSKVEQEKVALSYADRLPVVIVRPPGVYGERDTEILAFFKMMSKGWCVRMGLDNKELSLVHVRDLVQGMYLAATQPDNNGEIYFLGSLECYNWKQIGAVTAKVMQRKTKALPIPHFLLFTVGAFGSLMEKWFKSDVDLNIDRARRITRPSWYCSSEKAVKELGYQQTLSLEEGIKRTLDWYKEKGWLK